MPKALFSYREQVWARFADGQGLSRLVKWVNVIPYLLIHLLTYLLTYLPRLRLDVFITEKFVGSSKLQNSNFLS